MKATIEGTEVELSVAEFVELQRALGKNKPVPAPQEPPQTAPIVKAEPPKTPAPFKRNTEGASKRKVLERNATVWTDQEKTILRDLYKANIANTQLQHGALKRIGKMMGRTQNSITKAISEFGIAVDFRKTAKKEAPPVPQGAGMIRKHAVVPADPDKERIKAAEQATGEKPSLKGWLNDARSKTAAPKPAPRIVEEKEVHMHTISPSDQDLFLSVVKDMIANQTRLSFLTHGPKLDIERGWDWVSFIEEFVQKKTLLAAYFGVPDYFEFSKYKDKYHEITYRRPARPALK